MGFDLIIRLKIGFSLLIVVIIWGVLASLVTGIISFPISVLLTTALITVAPIGWVTVLPTLIMLLVYLLFLPLTALFFGIVVPLLPEEWFLKNWRAAKQKSLL